MSKEDLVYVGEIEDPIDRCAYYQEKGNHKWMCPDCDALVPKGVCKRGTHKLVCEACSFDEDGEYRGGSYD